MTSTESFHASDTVVPLTTPARPSPWKKPFLRIGHAGASAYAPANTLESFERALELGVDIVEFDVRPCRDALILLHDDHVGENERSVSELALEEIRAIKARQGLRVATLDEAVDLLKGRSLLNVDLKAGGIEVQVIDVLRRKSILADAMISSLDPAALRKVRRLDPAVITAISYPEDRGAASTRPYLQPIVTVVLALMRATMPHRAIGLMASAEANAAMLYHKVVSSVTAERVHAAMKRIFVWTVDDLTTLRRLHSYGVDGIASNRPDLFAQM